LKLRKKIVVDCIISHLFLVKQAMIELLENQPLETITPDRGKDFSKHAEISQELNLVELHLT